MSELLLYEDTDNKLQICVGKMFGKKFERRGTLSY